MPPESMLWVIKRKSYKTTAKNLRHCKRQAPFSLWIRFYWAGFDCININDVENYHEKSPTWSSLTPDDIFYSSGKTRELSSLFKFAKICQFLCLDKASYFLRAASWHPEVKNSKNWSCVDITTASVSNGQLLLTPRLCEQSQSTFQQSCNICIIFMF